MTKKTDETKGNGGDIILFAGDPQALIFGTGVVHAQYVYAKQHGDAHQTPSVVCGVSMGSLNAAAIHQIEKLLQSEHIQTQSDKVQTTEGNTPHGNDSNVRVSDTSTAFMHHYLSTMLGHQGVMTVKWLTDSMPNINHFGFGNRKYGCRFQLRWYLTTTLYFFIKKIKIKLGALKAPILDAFFQNKESYSKCKFLLKIFWIYSWKMVCGVVVGAFLFIGLVCWTWPQYKTTFQGVLLTGLILGVITIAGLFALWYGLPRLYGTGLTTTDAIKANLKALFPKTTYDTLPKLVVSRARLNPKSQEENICWGEEIKEHSNLLDFLSTAVSPLGVFTIKKDHIDGGVLRNNPLPAFFNWADDKRQLIKGAKAIIVFGSPELGEPSSSVTKRPMNNFGTTGLTVLRLLRRSEMNLEMKQTRLLSALAKTIENHQQNENPSTNTKQYKPPISIDIEALHPEQDITLGELIKKQHTGQSYKIAAKGCAARIAQLQRNTETKTCAYKAHGISTLCHHCTGCIPEYTHSDKTAPNSGLKKQKADKNLEKQTVVVVNGGVFRGSFHIGMIAALVTAGLRPHAIFGASVGALMGAAMASIFEYDENADKPLDEKMFDEEAKARGPIQFPGGNGPVRWTDARQKKLKTLIDLFADVPNKVAFTDQLRFTTQLVFDLAINRYGAAPKVKTLTRWLESPFILVEAIQRVQQHILETHEIQSMMGSDLLRQAIEAVLHDTKLDQLQPFVHKNGAHNIEFYATTTNLKTEDTEVLGKSISNCTDEYSFVDSLLASSAFPLLFSPVPKNHVYLQYNPGNNDVLLCDGGIFDNLPIGKAIDWLSQKQINFNSTPAQWNVPHRLILGALSADPTRESDGYKKTPYAVYKQGQKIKNNYKLYSYQKHATKVSACVKALKDIETRNPSIKEENAYAHLKANTVQLAVQIIEPSDDKHINDTFAFSPFTGFKLETFHKSITNGCYQTLLKLAQEQNGFLTKEKKQSPDTNIKHPCPYFLRKGVSFECPLATETDTILYDSCRHDPIHISKTPNG